MPRKPIGEKAMTAAERKRRQRERERAAPVRNAAQGDSELIDRIAELENELEEAKERPHLSAVQAAEMVMFCIDASSTVQDGPILIHHPREVRQLHDQSVKFLGLTRYQWMELPDEFLAFWGEPLTSAVAYWRELYDWFHVDHHTAPQWDRREILAEHERRCAQRADERQRQQDEERAAALIAKGTKRRRKS